MGFEDRVRVETFADEVEVARSATGVLGEVQRRMFVGFVMSTEAVDEVKGRTLEVVVVCSHWLQLLCEGRFH